MEREEPRFKITENLSVSLVLSLSKSISENKEKEQAFVDFCEKNKIRLWMSQEEIDHVKTFLMPRIEGAGYIFSSGVVDILERSRCKE